MKNFLENVLSNLAGPTAGRAVHYYMALSHEDWELQNSRI